jgi:lipopolysaccharide export system protein LptC
VIHSLRQAWERASIYLPVLLMGVFALGTYWLVRSTPMILPAAPPAPTGHEPDYLMHKFSVRTFDGDGQLKSEVLGVDARHFPDTDTMEVDGVRIRSFDELGRLTTATARQALTNRDGSEVQLIGDAHVIREPVQDASGQLLDRLEFKGEFLHAYMETERVKSHLPVELIRGRDRFTADSMDYDNQERVVNLKGRVKGRLVPSRVQ